MNTQTVYSEGTICLNFKLNDRTTDFEIMKDLREQVILGFPWLSANCGVIDMNRRCLYVGEAPMIIAYWRRKRTLPKKEILELGLTAEQINGTVQSEIKAILDNLSDVFTNRLTQPKQRKLFNTK